MGTAFRIITIAAVLVATSCTDFHEEEAPTGLSVDAKELTFSKDGGSSSFIIISGAKWDASGLPEWMKLDTISQSETSPYEWTISVSAQPNSDYHREGRIIIKTNSEKVDIPVAQDGKKGDYVAIESISLSPTSLELKVGDSKNLSVTILPKNASDQSVSWSSSDTRIVSVTTSGHVFAESAGSAVITVTTNDGHKTATCSAVVSQKKSVIQFADANLKQYLLSYYDSDHDNEISYEEAAAVTSIVSLNSVKSITSFDEFQFFTGVKSVPDNWLQGCQYLKSVVLPSSILTIGSSAFENCKGLQSINLNKDITVNDLAFAGTNLTGVVNVSSFFGEAFKDTSISDIYTYSQVTNDYSDFDISLLGVPEKTIIHIPEGIYSLMSTAVSFISSFSQSFYDLYYSWLESGERISAKIVVIESSLMNYRDVIIPAVVSGQLDKSALSGFTGISSEIDATRQYLLAFKETVSAQIAEYHKQNADLSPFFESIRTEQSKTINDKELEMTDSIHRWFELIEICRTTYNELFETYEYLWTGQSNVSHVSPQTTGLSPLRASAKHPSAPEVVELFNTHVVSFRP